MAGQNKGQGLRFLKGERTGKLFAIMRSPFLFRVCRGRHVGDLLGFGGFF